MLDPETHSSVDHLNWTEDSSPLLSTEWFLGAVLLGLTVTCVAAAFFSTAGQFATLGTLLRGRSNRWAWGRSRSRLSEI
jgi:hypothetical protein